MGRGIKKLKRKKNGNTKRAIRACRLVPTVCDSGGVDQDQNDTNSDKHKTSACKSVDQDERRDNKSTTKGKHYCPEGGLGDSLTCNFWERGDAVSGEQRMWYSVLAITLRDYSRGCDVAWAWVWDDGHEVGGYLWVCEVLGICAHRVRGKIKAGKMIEPASSTTITWTLRANSLPQSVDVERRRRIRRERKT